MKYLSFNELCARLGGRSRTTIYRDLSAGRLPQPIKLGGRVYWNEAELVAAIEALRGLEVSNR